MTDSRDKHPEQPHPNNYVNISKHLNQNLMIISEIEGLMSQVNDKLGELPEDICRLSYQFKSQAIEEIDLFQKTTLFDLRKAFE